MKHISISGKTLSEKITATLMGYIKAQLILIVITTITSWILLSLLGVRFALLLALFTGASSVAPILGNTIAAVIAALVATVDNARFLPNLPEIVEGLVVFVLFGIMNFLIDYLISPFLTGRITNVHPLILILAVIVGTVVFGVPGALLSVPVVLVTKTILDHNDSNLQTK